LKGGIEGGFIELRGEADPKIVDDTFANLIFERFSFNPSLFEK
jgi:hypothetical protein